MITNIQFGGLNCDKTFTDNRYLDMHVKSFHEGKRLECEKCGKSYTNSNSLRRHLDWHKVKENGLKFICKQCKKIFSSRDSFGKHLRTQGFEV